MSIDFKGPDGFSAPINFIKMYSDNTPMVKTDDFENIVAQADTMILRPHTLNDFVVGMFLVDSVTSQGGNIEKLVIPYLPGARQDRVNITGDILFTAKSVASMINARSFLEVLAVDPHSPNMPAMINRFVEYPLERVASKLWGGYSGIIAPDKGAHSRAEQFWKALGTDKEMKYGSKVRDVSTGKLTGFSVDPLTKGAHYLVVDDICDGGGTFIGLGEKIREQGAFADLFVTHGIFSKGTTELKKIYKNIYTTDSRHVNERNDVYRILVVEDMEKYNA